MKTNMLFILGILLIPAISFAQDSNKNQGKAKPMKGYYAIENNADKLISSEKNTFATATVIDAKKGYFAIGKTKQQTKQAVILNTGIKPKVTKGYYAIGKNADKL